MSTVQDQGERAIVPATTPIDADTLQRQRDLIDLERYALRRWLTYSPDARRVDWQLSDPQQGGAASPASQTIDGNDQDPFHGVAVFNPNPWPVGVGFQAGVPARAILTVAPFSWLAVPQRFTNMAVRLQLPTVGGVLDPSALPAGAVVSVAVLRLRMPPLAPAGGPLTAPELRGVALIAGTAVGAAGQAAANIAVGGASKLWLSASLVTVTAADLTLALFPWEPTGTLGALALPPAVTQGPTLAGGSSRMLRQFDVTALDVVQAQLGNAGAGATTGALSWWAA